MGRGDIQGVEEGRVRRGEEGERRGRERVSKEMGSGKRGEEGKERCTRGESKVEGRGGEVKRGIR